jgi:hypothetical protein
MLRVILRNIQHTLVLASVLLVFLALQRLHQFDFPLYSSSGRIEDYQPGEPSKVGGHHQVVFGRGFRIGLFRFMFPRLERTSDPSWHPDLDDSLGPKRKKCIVVMVDMRDCEESSIDASILLKQAIQSFGIKDVKVHGLVPERCSGINTTRELAHGHWLDQLVFMQKDVIWQTLGHELALKAKLVIRVPVEAILVGAVEATSSKRRLGTRLASSTRQLSNEPTAPHSIQWIRPSLALAKNSTLAEQSTLRCSTYPCVIPTSRLNLDLFTSTCPPPWECTAIRTTVSDNCNVMLDRWKAVKNAAFGGLNQSDTCDAENKYIPFQKPERPTQRITNTRYD